MTSANLENFL
jgi:hypothetical protein